MPLSISAAVLLSLAMIAATIFIFFYHDRKHHELDRWVDFGFSAATLRHALLYYRFVGIAMLVFFVLFVVSVLWLQRDVLQPLFLEGKEQGIIGFIAVFFFALDLVTRGSLFDFMQHFDLRLTPLRMNRQLPWFVWYCFVFRMFYALALVKVLFSFVWIFTKIRAIRSGHAGRPD